MIEKYVLRDLGKILKGNHEKLRAEFGRETNAMRVYERALGSLDFSVDLYGSYAVVTMYAALDSADLKNVADTVASNLYVAKEKVIFKKRVKGEDYVSIYDTPVNTSIMEAGLVFNVELAMKMDTGFFLDNYRARMLVRELSERRDVLNLFAYTGGYSVNAAYGGASSVTSVDTSASALEIARCNMEANGFYGDIFRYERKDAIEYVKEAPARSFDIIVFDAPSFSNGHGGRRFDMQKDHVSVLNDCARLLKKDGVILFRTSLSTFKLDKEGLADFRILTYTAEMLSPGFTRKSPIVRTFALRLLSSSVRYRIKVLKRKKDKAPAKSRKSPDMKGVR